MPAAALLHQISFVLACGTYFCYRLCKPQSLVSRYSIEVIHLIRSRTPDLLACSILPGTLQCPVLSHCFNFCAILLIISCLFNDVLILFANVPTVLGGEVKK
jgi:hypothetical protein